MAICCIGGHLADHHFFLSTGFVNDPIVPATPNGGKFCTSVVFFSACIVHAPTELPLQRENESATAVGCGTYAGIFATHVGVLPLNGIDGFTIAGGGYDCPRHTVG